MRMIGKALLVMIAAMAVAGVAKSIDGKTEKFEVAGHHFSVPEDHMFEMEIPWLPKSESDSFTFLLEPNPTPDQIPPHRVLVQRLSRLCPTDAKTEGARMLRIVCGQETNSVHEEPPFVKLQNELGSWSSDLYAIEHRPDGSATQRRRKVAYCQFFEPNPAKPQATTLCTTFWAYNGLMLQFSFDEKEASKMPAMKAQAMALLDRWEVR